MLAVFDLVQWSASKEMLEVELDEPELGDGIEEATFIRRRLGDCTHKLLRSDFSASKLGFGWVQFVALDVDNMSVSEDVAERGVYHGILLFFRQYSGRRFEQRARNSIRIHRDAVQPAGIGLEFHAHARGPR